jgi:hypothetical protein
MSHFDPQECSCAFRSEANGQEVRVYDESRQPGAWNELLTPSQCAVFFKRLNSETPLSAEGAPFPRLRDSTFLLFSSLELALQYCDAKVREHPEMSCEVFNSAGKARPPLLVIVHPNMAEKDDLSASSVRLRKGIAIALFLAAIPLFWWDRRANGLLVMPTFLALTSIVAGLRILHWNMARGERIEDQKERVRAHLRREKNTSG